MHINLDGNAILVAASKADASVREAAGELLVRLQPEGRGRGGTRVLTESQFSVPLLEEILLSKQRKGGK